MLNAKNKIRLNGPMSYDYHKKLTADEIITAKRRAKEFSAEVKKELDEEFGDESSERK